MTGKYNFKACIRTRLRFLIKKKKASITGTQREQGNKCDEKRQTKQQQQQHTNKQKRVAFQVYRQSHLNQLDLH